MKDFESPREYSESEENFRQFEESVKRRVAFVKEKISEFQSQSNFPDKYQQYADAIDSEAFLLINRAQDIQGLLRVELEKVKESYRPKIDELFDVPEKIMDTRLKATEIRLDSKPFDVWEAEVKKNGELLNQLEQLTAEYDNPAIKESIENIKKSFGESLMNLYDATNERVAALDNLFLSYQDEHSKWAAQEVSRRIEEHTEVGGKTLAPFNSELFTLIDNFSEACNEAVNKAQAEFVRERSQLN